MKISVIVPVYNVADYIDKCIKSIVNQTYTDFELIIIDDGSKDESGKICRYWAGEDSRIVLVEQNNAGVSTARNAGIKKARGEYIVFVDGDDYLEETFLEEMLGVMNKNPHCEIVMCGYKYDDGKSVKCYNFFESSRYFDSNDRDMLICRAIGVNENEIRRKTNIGVPWAKMYRKDFIYGNSLLFDKDMPKMQDLVFNVRCFNKVTSAAYINKYLYDYVYRPESTVNKYNIDYDRQAKLILDRLSEELSSNDSNEVVEALRYEAILLLIECIRLKYAKRESTLDLLSKRREIKKICDNEPYRSSIKHTYRHIRNSAAQNCFLFSLKCNMFLVAYFLVVIKYKKN